MKNYSAAADTQLIYAHLYSPTSNHPTDYWGATIKQIRTSLFFGDKLGFPLKEWQPVWKYIHYVSTANSTRAA